MYKTIILSLFTFVSVAALGVMFILATGFGNSSANVESKEASSEPVVELSAPNDDEKDVNAERIDSADVAADYEGKVEPAPDEVEAKVVDMIHRMSHQKVRAEHKWGHLKITEERLDEVVGLLEQYDVEDRTFLHEEMLNWKEGDFYNAVKVHNILTQPEKEHVYVTGTAYGLLSKAEEQTYIENHFDEVDDIPKEDDEGYQNRNQW